MRCINHTNNNHSYWYVLLSKGCRRRRLGDMMKMISDRRWSNEVGLIWDKSSSRTESLFVERIIEIGVNISEGRRRRWWGRRRRRADRIGVESSCSSRWGKVRALNNYDDHDENEIMITPGIGKEDSSKRELKENTRIQNKNLKKLVYSCKLLELEAKRTNFRQWSSCWRSDRREWNSLH